MDYTLSNSYVTHAGTGQRMHEENQAIPTQVSEKDMNSLLWGAMEVVKAAGLAGQQFNEATPATYKVFVSAIKRLAGSNVKTVTAAGATALTADDAGLILVDATLGNQTITLPAAAASLGVQRFEFFRIDTGANTVSVAAAGAEKIDVVNTTFALVGQADVHDISSTGVGWVTTSLTPQGIKPSLNAMMVAPASAYQAFNSNNATQSISASLTAPCAGYVFAVGNINQASPVNYVGQLLLNGAVFSSDTTTQPQGHSGFVAVTKGQVCTAQTLISCVAGYAFGLRASLFFIPKP